MASEGSDHDSSVVPSGEASSSDDECFTVDDIMNALKNSSNNNKRNNNNYNISRNRCEQENNEIINIDDLECVVYDEAGVLKNVNALCNYVINNENCVDNKINLKDNDVNIVNLTDIISNHDTLSLRNLNDISSNNYDVNDSVVHEKVDSNDNTLTDHSQTPEEKNYFSETEPKKRQKIAEPKEWDRNKAKILRMKGSAYMGYRRENPKNINKILNDVMRESRKM